MENQKQKDKAKYSSHIIASDSGILEMLVVLPDLKLNKQEKENVIVNELIRGFRFMCDKGYWDTGGEEYGCNRKHWEKLLKENKIPYRDDDNIIKLDLWIKGFLENEEEINEYVKNRDKIIDSTENADSKHIYIDCPKCKKKNFSANMNVNNINGSCSNCGFYVHTTV